MLLLTTESEKLWQPDSSDFVTLTPPEISLMCLPSPCLVPSFIIFEDVNPDGTALGRRGNAKGVDLNRNYPATNFLPGSNYGQRPLDQERVFAGAAAVGCDQGLVDPVRPGRVRGDLRRQRIDRGIERRRDLVDRSADHLGHCISCSEPLQPQAQQREQSTVVRLSHECTR